MPKLKKVRAFQHGGVFLVNLITGLTSTYQLVNNRNKKQVIVWGGMTETAPLLKKEV